MPITVCSLYVIIRFLRFIFMHVCPCGKYGAKENTPINRMHDVVVKRRFVGDTWDFLSIKKFAF